MGSIANPSTKQLKDTISTVLDSKGVLSKIRAHLRASVLTSVENLETVYGENESAKRIHASSEARAMVDLIREFLEFYGMDFTLSVFLHEANIAKSTFGGRSGLAKHYSIDPASNSPILADIINQKKPLSTPSAGSFTPSNAAPALRQEQPEKKEPTHPPPKKMSSLADLPGLSSNKASEIGNRTSSELGRKEPLKPLAKDMKPSVPALASKVTQPATVQPKKAEPLPVNKIEPSKPEAKLTSLRNLPSPLGKVKLDEEEEADNAWKEKEKIIFKDDDDDIEEDFGIEEEDQYEDDFEDTGESDATEDRSADDIDVSGYEFSEMIRK